jgi:2-amino-4-hydroxy-6-hydroxymethyldihydropteridine diphosphokinase
MAVVFLGLGSNIGDRLEFLRAGMKRIRAIDMLEVVTCSSVYETEPVGQKNQGTFLNAVVKCRSECDPRNLMPILMEVERMAGRKKRERWGPRELDIDILYCGDMVVTSRVVRIPHPEIPHRRFVLAPLAEIAPDFPDPLRGSRVKDLLRRCPGNERLKKIMDKI